MTLARTVFASLVLLGVIVNAARSDDDHPWHKHFEVHPAAQPTPGLKYRFFPATTERHPGNAALAYLRAEVDLRAHYKSVDPDEKFDQPIEKLPLADLRSEIAIHRALFADLAAAARSQTCDWDLQVGPRMWTGPWSADVQQTRSFARWLALKARLEILEGKYDEASRTLETGFALARHVGEAPSLISALIAVAICNVMLDAAADLIERPNSPNLYWALTSLPRPFLDASKTVDEEFAFLTTMFPVFNDIDSPRTADEWRSAVQEQFDLLTKWGILGSADGQNDYMLSSRAFKLYPSAKRRLIAGGRTAEAVNAMPVLEVLLRDNWQTFAEFRDAVQRASLLPFPEGILQVAAAEQHQGKELEQRFLPFSDYLPILSLGWKAEARTDRKIAAMRVVEAIRMYAAAHQGQPPGQLSEIREVSVPNDPATGQPFGYSRGKKQAVISAPKLSDDKFDDSLRYEIQF